MTQSTEAEELRAANATIAELQERLEAAEMLLKGIVHGTIRLGKMQLLFSAPGWELRTEESDGSWTIQRCRPGKRRFDSVFDAVLAAKKLGCLPHAKQEG